MIVYLIGPRRLPIWRINSIITQNIFIEISIICVNISNMANWSYDLFLFNDRIFCSMPISYPPEHKYDTKHHSCSEDSSSFSFPSLCKICDSATWNKYDSYNDEYWREYDREYFSH